MLRPQDTPSAQEQDVAEIQLTPWFSRSFAGGLTTEAWLPLLERLRGAPVRVAALVAGVAAEALRRRLAGWSTQERVGHLGDLEPLWLSRFEALQVGAALPAADLSNRRTHGAGHNDRGIADVVRAFESSRARLLAHLEPYDVAAALRTGVHPRLGTTMSAVDLAYFVAEHDDHHLVQIRRLLQGRAAMVGD